MPSTLCRSASELTSSLLFSRRLNRSTPACGARSYIRKSQYATSTNGSPVYRWPVHSLPVNAPAPALRTTSHRSIPAPRPQEVAFLQHTRSRGLAAENLSLPIALRRACSLECLFFTDGGPTWRTACHESAAASGVFPITWSAIELFKGRADLRAAADGCLPDWQVHMRAHSPSPILTTRPHHQLAHHALLDGTQAGGSYRHRCCRQALSKACALLSPSERADLGWASCSPRLQRLSTSPQRPRPVRVWLETNADGGGGSYQPACQTMIGLDFDCGGRVSGICEVAADEASWRCAQEPLCVGYVVHPLTRHATLKMRHSWQLSSARTVECQRLSTLFHDSRRSEETVCGAEVETLALRWTRQQCAHLAGATDHAGRWCVAQVRAAQIRMQRISNAQGYKLLHTGGECNSDDVQLGSRDSVEECAAACAVHEGCRYFVFGYASRSHRCLYEKTLSPNCHEGCALLHGFTPPMHMRGDGHGASPHL